MRLKFSRGRKHPKDTKVEYECTCGRRFAPTFEDIVTLVVITYRNEELIYPRSLGYQGGRMFLKLLQECVKENKIPDKKVLRRYMLDKNCETYDRRF